MDKSNIKEKRLYFLFSKLNDKQNNKTHFTLIIDSFINKDNSYLNLIEISNELIRIGIKIKPESLKQTVENPNYSSYFEYEDSIKIDTPFKLKKLQYDTFSSYEDYYKKLDSYVFNFLKSEKIDSNKSEIIKEILLTTLFKRNLAFLKQLITCKDANELENLLILDTNGHYEDKDCEIYNNLILSSGHELNEIIQVLLYKIFDFLQLHYNPNIDTTLNEQYKNKVFYLDSSFIIRLLGFDNEIREHRAIELINILNKIDGVKFYIHNSTIIETQNNIKNLIDSVYKLIGHSEKTIKSIENISYKRDYTIDLYLRLKQKGRIVNREDFILNFSNVYMKLKSIIGSNLIERDDNNINYSKDKFEALKSALSTTEKTSSRIKHISKLLLYIESLRQSNNYNLYDIKYWLITTDNSTLKIDGKIRSLKDDNSKSVCILPTELLRAISNRAEISTDYIEVFKQFMIYSNAFAAEYSNQELETIEKVVTLAESANTDEYDVDYFINNLFDEITLNELVTRLNKSSDEEKRDRELISIFENTFGGDYRAKYFNLIARRIKAVKFISFCLRYVVLFILPAFLIYAFIKNIINPELSIFDLSTYIDEEKWSKLQYIPLILQALIIPISVWLNNKYGLKFQNWLYNKFIKNEPKK
jgi:hypothetical protein